MADKALKDLSPVFEELYSRAGRPSIPQEQLLRSLLLQILCSIRRERLLIEQLNCSLLFRWFVGLSLDAEIWNHSVYAKNRDRIIHSDAAALFLQSILDQAKEAGLLSDEHFTVDGTLIESWASLKSLHPRDEEPPASSGRDPELEFHGEKRSNAAHVSNAGPEARLYRKSDSQPARLSFLGHALMENRNGLVVDTRVTQAAGRRRAGSRALHGRGYPRETPGHPRRGQGL